MTQDPIKMPLVLQPKIWNRQLMFLHYLFDSTITSNFKQRFQEWWKQYYAFPGLPVENVRVQLVPSTNRTIESFFIHKKPSREILTKMGM